MKLKKRIIELEITIEKLIESVDKLSTDLFAIKNKPEFKPFDEVTIRSYLGFGFNGKGLVMTEAKATPDRYIYQVRVANEIHSISEGRLTRSKKKIVPKKIRPENQTKQVDTKG